MPNIFLQTRWHRVGRDDVEIRINTVVAGSMEPREAVLLPDGSYDVFLHTPQTDEHHTELGKFLDAFSRLEHLLSGVLGFVIGCESEKAMILRSSLNMAAVLEVLNSTVATTLHGKPEKLDAFQALTERVKRLSTIRNRLAHGMWCLHAEIAVYEKVSVRTFPVREYFPTDPTIREALFYPENRDIRRKHYFKVPAIKESTKHIETLIEDFLSSSENIFGKGLHQGLGLEIRS